ncbi:MAG: bifunctional UDP-3-O-[3-hydroxymyristoyl] N-acetylglucosamine deacetylase/3-hydroxyacyl-ACP dehydratase [Chlorobi bacterium]|nr:MAG: UDP-3-O-(3-hydroxymyristoyl) N-acetylglucosamine deacetylase [Chlorobi bacterium OLB7]MBK8912456.1 bifunctional UDP-3-O-[3-hydroxymyristoyl] N-acetylglucosamine deacetylase/3-hydroxyacyl-ACP dehydratase [Chlorobiota bacterium]MBX7217642.1 bifunctional UDP-3-O-[3-hydroxymyristoyl] N-acetylglucosamine deacetylase/3-hydroxyacyl-ACP dehydratase [Candidatus Kapabacteria bacterium]
MKTTQHTIASPVSFSGVGLHTGNPSTITFRPAPENHGFRFLRTDLPDAPEVPADVDLVTDVSRGTTLSRDGVSIHTVEHVLAALTGLEIDNCSIELSNNEPPVGDGSAMPFTEVLMQAGIVDQQTPRNFIVVDSIVKYANEAKGVEITALPNQNFQMTVMIDYRNPALGRQHSGLLNLESEFVKEVAPARTFCFLTEVEWLRSEGLIKGGRLDNAIVIVDKDVDQSEINEMSHRLGIDGSVVLGSTGVLNNGSMRFVNEPARHKLLDLLGDLALAGAPVKAHILAARPGHASNIEFARKIKRAAEKSRAAQKKSPPMDIRSIMNILPHRYPFLLVDRILDVDLEAKKVIGLKNVTINEPFFIGHFPEQPIMPGVLIVEAMAQTGGILLMQDMGGNAKQKLALFMGINNCKFRKPVLPGDQLQFEVSLKSKKFNTYLFSGRATVNGTLVAEAELTVAVGDRTNPS